MTINALLCDAATVEQNRINILGGNSTVLPHGVVAALAILFAADWNELGERYDFTVRIVDQDENAVKTDPPWQFNGWIVPQKYPGQPPGSRVTIAYPVRSVETRLPLGRYSYLIEVPKANASTMVPFQALGQPQQIAG